MRKERNSGSGNSITRRDFVRGALTAGVGVALSGIAGKALSSMAPVPAGAVATVPELILSDPKQMKILQVTDTHMHFVARGFLGEPEKSKSIKSMIEKFSPDVMINTGDFWANVTEDKADSAKELCKEFAKYKTRWAFVWGNHDESKDYNKTHAMLEGAPYSLYRGAAADGNYRIAVKAKEGGETLWNFIMLNDSRGGFKQEQIDWFNAEVQRIKKETPVPPPAFLFFHIPLPQYNDIAFSGRAIGVKFENVCHENGSAEAFGAFKAAGFVKAMFCGHDHVNDYYGYLNGIRLQYGRALGGYGEDRVRKGGSIISVDLTSGKFDTKSVFPDGTSVVYDTFITKQEPGRIY